MKRRRNLVDWGLAVAVLYLFAAGSCKGSCKSPPKGCPSCPLGHMWSKRFGGDGEDVGYRVAVDYEGNVCLAGYFSSSTIDFGGGELKNAGEWDIFLAKFDRDGRHVWSKRFGGEGIDNAGGLALDEDGNVYLTGSFESPTINFGGGDLGNAGHSDIFLAKFDRDGRHQWSKAFGARGADWVVDVAVDHEGNAYVTGHFSSSALSFGGGELQNRGVEDIFVAKFNRDGRHVWSKRFGGTAMDWPQAIAVDRHGNLYLTGSFSSPTINFGGDDLFRGQALTIFLVKLDAGGGHVWSYSFPGGLLDMATDVAVDDDGNAYLTGWFNGSTINFGGVNLKNTSVDKEEIFLAKFNKDGRHVWSKAFGGDEGEAGWGVALDHQGSIYLAGSFNSRTVNFGRDDLRIQNSGRGEIFVAKFDRDGRHVWSKAFGGPSEEIAYGIAADRDGNVYLTGKFDSASIEFGGDPLWKAGGSGWTFGDFYFSVADVFLVKFSPIRPVPR